MKKTMLITLLIASTLSLNAFASDGLSDIEGHKNQSAIEYLYQNNVISGYSDGSFQPEKSVNRAELLKILVGAKGITPTVENYKNCFSDVKEEWFAPYVCYAKTEGWIDGYSDGTFKPAKEITKVEAIKMLVNSQGYDITSTVDGALFDDADSDQWYAPYLQVAKAKGLLEIASGEYGVGLNIDRAEISENIYRATMIGKDGLDQYASGSLYTVTRVIDGDTIEVNDNLTIRLIGVDTPETVHPSKPVQCFGQEASAIAKEKLLNQTVALEEDESQGDVDKYDRLLRYVFLVDGTNFNEWLIENGYGHEYTYDTPYKYQDEFVAAENSAMDNGAGLWADGVCDEESVDTITPEVTEITEDDVNTASYVCSSNYYNCSDFSSHSEAQAVYDYCAAETGKDIHKLDGDSDGSACESL